MPGCLGVQQTLHTDCVCVDCIDATYVQVVDIVGELESMELAEYHAAERSWMRARIAAGLPMIRPAYTGPEQLVTPALRDLYFRAELSWDPISADRSHSPLFALA